MSKKGFQIAWVAALALFVGNAARAGVYDLSSNGFVTVNGAYFGQSYLQPAGSGVLNPFLTVQATNTEQGYNSSTGNFDTKRSPQFNHEIQIADLKTATIGGASYYSFVIDVNEPNSSTIAISLEQLKIFTSATVQNNTSTDSNGLFNGSLGTLRYNLDAGTSAANSNSVYYVDQNHGSGQADIVYYVPTSLFAGAKSTDYVYTYQQFGRAQGGFEETSMGMGGAVVPEVSSLIPASGILLLIVGFPYARRWLRRSRATV
jgi:hypothetical protein